jgi:hypothetical protein
MILDETGGVDHVTVAGTGLDALRDPLEAAGFAPGYGGEHDNSVTEMAAVGFPDGSYLELIAAVTADPAPFWDAQIRADGGPCGWAVGVDDLQGAVDRLRDRGVAVEGPTELSRERPDGTLLEWSMAFPGPGDPGSHLPFLLTDHTPREQRARPGRGSEGTGVTGVERVVLGVETLAAGTDRYRTAFDLAAPERREEPAHGVRVARFPDAPVDLVAPQDGGWLADRLDAFGPGPCTFLLGSDGTAEAGTAGTWLGREVGWLDVTGGPGPADLGILR